jgi:solute carrier family 6 amino acid transporter-like protein 5/7/9/14
MEMVLGQLSSRGTIKIYDFAPGMRGVGVGQVISTFSVSTFYASVLALTLKYLVESFNSDLPWATCKANWTDCKNSTEILVDVINSTDSRKLVPSAALYFSKEVVKEKASIDDGLGDMNWNLVAFLGFSWALVFLIMIKGIRSSGKASYVLAVFPYVILSILLGRAITLPGAWDGIVYFLKPQWREMLNYQVWFDAVTQVFFSLNICFGCVSMYSSYNKFNHNIYRDVNIISILDTCTSLLAGCITFGILGHLSHLTGDTDIYKKTGGGPGLAFVTYPDALAKFQLLPQAFSVLFFLMLYTLGIGSIISMIACCMTVIRDKFPAVKNWQAALVGAILGFAVGTTYLRQGGLEIVSLVDFFGAQWVAFIFAIAELVAVFYIYGVERFCKDIEFMLGFRPGLYWRMCWKYIVSKINLEADPYYNISFFFRLRQL